MQIKKKEKEKGRKNMAKSTIEKRQIKPTLNAVRYTKDELIDFCTDQFYEEVATSTKVYFQDKVAEEGQIRPRTRLEKRLKRIEKIKYRIADFKARQAEETNEEDIKTYQKGIDLLVDKLDYEENPTIERQKQEYEKKKDVFGSRTFTEFPLNKKINSLYDDFNCIVLFYDNLTTEEIVSKLENAPTLEEKKQIVKDNVEITHMIIRIASPSGPRISLLGKIDEEYSNPSNPSAQILPPKFADFDSLTLADCESIANNDLQQIVQERIDMSRENLEVVDEAVIKGEKYTINKSPNGKLYISYTCPSTQRVYYNALNLNYLAQSPYFKEGDVSTYIKSWYNISNLFIELTDEEIKRPSISC